MSVVTFPQRVKQDLPYLCSQCGADRGCDCNAPAIEKIAQARAANPTGSTRAIAKAAGVSQSTAQRAMKPTEPDGSVERTGIDGKTRRMPRRASRDASVDNAEDYSDLPDEFRPVDPQGVKFVNRLHSLTADYSHDVRAWLRRCDIDQRTREVLSRSMHQCANSLHEVAQELVGITNDELEENE